MDQLCEEPYFDVTIDENEIVDGAKEIIKKIRPTWPLEKLHFKVRNFANDNIGSYKIFIYVLYIFIFS